MLKPFDHFLLFLKTEKGLSQNTVVSYQHDLSDFYNFVKEKEILDVSKDDVERYIHHSLAIRTPRSTARHLSTIRQFFKFLKREKAIQTDPTDFVEMPSWRQGLPKILTEEEIQKLFDTAYSDRSIRGIRLCVLLEILYASGLRVSELINLKKSNLTSCHNYPILRIVGKGNKERIVPLHEKAYQQIEAYLPYVPESSDYLFGNRRNRPMTRMRVFQLLKALALKAGIDPVKVSPHVIRHAFATHMLKNGADLVILKEILGHENLSTSEIYLHVLPEDLQELVEKYHPIKYLLK